MYKRFRICLIGLAAGLALAALGVFVADPGTALAERPTAKGKPQTPCYECVPGETAWTVDITGYVSPEDVVGVLIGKTGGPSRCLNNRGDLRFDSRPDTLAKSNFGALTAVPRVEAGPDSLDCVNNDTRPVDFEGFRSNGFTFRQLDAGQVEYNDGVILLVGGEAIEHTLLLTGTGTVLPSGGEGSTSTVWLTDYDLRPRAKQQSGCRASGVFSQPIMVVVTETKCP